MTRLPPDHLLRTVLRKELSLPSLRSLRGFCSFMILWDLKKFFDAIDIATLIKEAARGGFPKLQLILSLVVHHGG